MTILGSEPTRDKLNRPTQGYHITTADGKIILLFAWSIYISYILYRGLEYLLSLPLI